MKKPAAAWKQVAVKGDALPKTALENPARSAVGTALPLAGMCLSAIGSWCTRIAIAWLLFRQTGSPLWLGLAAFAGQSPVLFCAPLAGRLLARMGSLEIYRLAQALAALEAAALALLASSGHLTPAAMLACAVLRGIISAFEHPARQNLLAARARSANGLRAALAGDSLQANIARLIGPLAAGLLLARFGETACFLADSASYGAALAASLWLRGDDRPADRARPAMHSLKAVFQSGPACLRPLSLLAVISLVGTTFTVLLPQFCRDVLAGGAESLARLVAASGVGASLAALVTLLWPDAAFERQLPRLCAASGGFIALLCLASHQTPALLCVGAASLFAMLQITATAATLRQAPPAGIDPAVLQSALFWGLMPFGSLLMSGLAQLIGPRGAYLTAGMTAMTAAMLVSLAARRDPRWPAPCPHSRPGGMYRTAIRPESAERSSLTNRWERKE